VTAFDDGPARLSVGLSICLAVAAALVLPVPVAVAIGFVGAALLNAGALLGAVRIVGYGTAVLLFAVVLAGLQGSGPVPLVASTLFALLAWDASRYGIRIGRQLGRGADTARVELAHTAMSTAVGATGAGLGYAAYRVADAGGSAPVAALALLFFGGVVLVATFR